MVVTARFKNVGCVGLLTFRSGDLAEFFWRFSGRIWFGPAVAVRAVVGDRADRMVWCLVLREP